jgi:hypothetical protein
MLLPALGRVKEGVLGQMYRANTMVCPYDELLLSQRGIEGDLSSFRAEAGIQEGHGEPCPYIFLASIMLINMT